jgi:hypothetical protein
MFHSTNWKNFFGAFLLVTAHVAMAPGAWAFNDVDIFVWDGNTKVQTDVVTTDTASPTPIVDTFNGATDAQVYSWSNGDEATVTISVSVADRNVVVWDCATMNLIVTGDTASFTVPSTASGSQHEINVYLNGPHVPVDCSVYPGVNKVTGAAVPWGQAAVQPVSIDPTDPGYPVRDYSGEVREEVVDFFMKGRGLDLVWSRVYQSRLGEDTAQGNNWDFSYNITVDFSSKVVSFGNGYSVAFTEVIGVNRLGAPGWEAELRYGDVAAGTFSLHFGDGIYWVFGNWGSLIASNRQ